VVLISGPKPGGPVLVVRITGSGRLEPIVPYANSSDNHIAGGNLVREKIASGRNTPLSP
jgi:hypothetical protein